MLLHLDNKMLGLEPEVETKKRSSFGVLRDSDYGACRGPWMAVSPRVNRGMLYFLKKAAT